MIQALYPQERTPYTPTRRAGWSQSLSESFQEDEILLPLPAFELHTVRLVTYDTNPTKYYYALQLILSPLKLCFSYTYRLPE